MSVEGAVWYTSSLYAAATDRFFWRVRFDTIEAPTATVEVVERLPLFRSWTKDDVRRPIWAQLETVTPFVAPFVVFSETKPATGADEPLARALAARAVVGTYADTLASDMLYRLWCCPPADWIRDFFPAWAATLDFARASPSRKRR